MMDDRRMYRIVSFLLFILGLVFLTVGYKLWSAHIFLALIALYIGIAASLMSLFFLFGLYFNWPHQLLRYSLFILAIFVLLVQALDFFIWDLPVVDWKVGVFGLACLVVDFLFIKKWRGLHQEGPC